MQQIFVEGVDTMPYYYLFRYGRLKQVALRSVAHSLAADSAALTDLREMFDVLDPDHRGFISHEAMLQARLFTHRIDCRVQRQVYGPKWLKSGHSWRLCILICTRRRFYSPRLSNLFATHCLHV